MARVPASEATRKRVQDMLAGAAGGRAQGADE